MKKFYALCCGFFLASSCIAQEGGKFILDADLSVKYNSGTFVIFKPDPGAVGGVKPMGTASAKKTEVQPKSEAEKKEEKIDAFLKGEKLIARAELVDGKVHLEVDVEEVSWAYYSIINGQKGNVRRWRRKGAGLVLEPGVVSFSYVKGESEPVIDGKYNSQLSAWKTTGDYKANKVAQAELKERRYTLGNKASLEEKDEMARQVKELRKSQISLKEKHLAEIASSSEDLLLRYMVFESQSKGAEWLMKPLYDTQKQHPELEWIAPEIAAREKAVAEELSFWKEHDAIIGSVVGDLKGDSLANVSVELRDVLAKNEYVLVDFWASWCSPCRGEFPYLKRAYGKFKEKGFEIYAFSMDSDKEMWAEASEEEELEWINVSDLAAFKGPVSKQFNISSIPASYLIEGATGKIVARNLRYLDLERKLAELMK